MLINILVYYFMVQFYYGRNAYIICKLKMGLVRTKIIEIIHRINEPNTAIYTLRHRRFLHIERNFLIPVFGKLIQFSHAYFRGLLKLAVGEVAAIVSTQLAALRNASVRVKINFTS